MSSQTIVTLALGVLEITSFSIMSRLLTKEDFGFYAAINAIVIVFSSLSDTGIGASIVQRKELTAKYLDNAFTLSVIFGLFSMFVLLIAANLLPDSLISPKMRLPLILMSLNLFFQCVSSVFKGILHRNSKFLTIGKAQFFSFFVTTIIAIFFAILGMGYYAIIVKSIMGAFLTFILFFFLSKSKFKLRLDKETSNNIFKFSGWLMASRLFSDLAKQIDALLLPHFISFSDFGAYSRPQGYITMLSTKINGIFDSALFPVLSSIQNDYVAMRKAYSKSLYLLNMFSLLITISFVLNSNLILRIFFGSEWLYLAGIFAIFSIKFFFNADGRLADCYIRSLGKTKYQFYFRIVEFGTKTIGVIIGSQWGILGITICIVALECFVKLIKIIFAGQIISMPLSEIFKIVFSSCRYVIILIPIALILHLLLPMSLWGDIIKCILYIVQIVLLFLFCPKIVGETYEREVYPIICRVRNIIKI